MTRRLFLPTPKPVVEDAAPPSIEPIGAEMDLSIDKELSKGLLAIHRLMKIVLTDISGGAPSKDSVSHLKACMDMLKDLKKSEIDLLNSLDDEALEKVVQDANAKRGF